MTQPTRLSFLIRAALIGVSLGALSAGSLRAASAYSDPASPSSKHIYVGQYDLTTNTWGIGGAGPGWYAYIFTNSTSTIDTSGYKWTGFTNGSGTGVKCYLSIRKGITNSQNSSSGLPYQFAANTKNVDVVWSFAPTNYDGTGSVQGSYNHTLDVFFSSSQSNNGEAYRKGEVMIITSSSANSQTSGWGTKDAAPYIDSDGYTWDVWQATMTANGYSWPVMQFRKRTNANYFNKNLKAFFAEAAGRRPDVFKSACYVMMVEAGTEVKTGSGKVYNTTYSVNVY